MINDLIQIMKLQLPQLLETANNWDSLVINKRKPYTYRVFTQINNMRLCLHKFDVCNQEESFMHPHPWQGAFSILKGSYRMVLGITKDRNSTLIQKVSEQILSAGSTYEILDPMVWHSVTPIETCYTIMLNGEPFSPEVAHSQVRTTRGKDLDKLSNKDLITHLSIFKDLIHRRS